MGFCQKCAFCHPGENLPRSDWAYMPLGEGKKNHSSQITKNSLRFTGHNSAPGVCQRWVETSFLPFAPGLSPQQHRLWRRVLLGPQVRAHSGQKELLDNLIAEKFKSLQKLQVLSFFPRHFCSCGSGSLNSKSITCKLWSLSPTTGGQNF